MQDPVILNSDHYKTDASSDVRRRHLRQQMRKQRRALKPEQQRNAGMRCAERLSTHGHWQKAQHIALYISDDGEVETGQIIERAWLAGKQVYLPVVLNDNDLAFVAYRKNDCLAKSKFGIAAPQHQESAINPTQLEIIVTPLVGFDLDGNRLGRGGGYYDRLLRRIREASQSPGIEKCLAIGLAHEFQQVEQLPGQPWDEPLDAVITPSNVLAF